MKTGKNMNVGREISTKPVSAQAIQKLSGIFFLKTKNPEPKTNGTPTYSNVLIKNWLKFVELPKTVLPTRVQD